MYYFNACNGVDRVGHTPDCIPCGQCRRSPAGIEEITAVYTVNIGVSLV